MDINDVQEIKEDVVSSIFTVKQHQRQFLHLVAALWRYSADNILLIYSQYPKATCVAGKRAFEALDLKVRESEKPIYILNTNVKCSDPGTYVTDEYGEQVMLNEGVPEYDPEPTYASEYRLVPAFDISQLTEDVSEKKKNNPDVYKLCKDVGLPIMEVDRFPDSWNYYSGYYDEGENAIMVKSSVKGDARTSAIIRAYVQFTLAGNNLQDKTPGTIDIFTIKSRENVAELISYCIEVYCGIRPSVSNVSIIFDNAKKDLETDDDMYDFISNICLFSQRIIQDLEGYPLTVEETNIVNSLMISDSPKLLRALYAKMDNQEEVSDGVKRVIARVFEQLIGPVTEKELSVIYDDRIHKNIFTYPPYLINVNPPIFASANAENRTNLLSHEQGVTR